VSQLDYLVKGGLVVDQGGILHADVAVREGQIVAIGADLEGEAKRTIDAHGKYVLPGSMHMGSTFFPESSTYILTLSIWMTFRELQRQQHMGA